MSYILNKKIKVDVKLEPHTRMAIEAFSKLLKAERAVAKRENELNMWLSEVSSDQMPHYVAITHQMQEDEKI